MAPQTASPAGRKTGDGVVLAVDRTKEIRRARRGTMSVKVLRFACPAIALLLLSIYGLSIARMSGLVTEETLPELAVRKVLPEDLSMKNPRYEGFGKDGSSYVFTAQTATPDLKIPHIIALNGIVGELYQPDKTRTDVTAKSGVFNNQDNVLELYEAIDVDSATGLKARLTRATILTKEDLLTSPEPVLVEFPNGSVRSKTMTLRQKAREATFSEDVVVELTPPADEREQSPAANDDSAALFTPTNGPIHIDSQRLDLNDGSKTALFTGNVQARQAGASLTTPELEVSYEGEGMMRAAAPAEGSPAAAAAGKVRRIIARQPVVMKRETGEVVTSDNAEFDAVAQTAVLTGEVIMTSGADRRATGERVEFDETAGTVLLSGDVVVTQGMNELRGGRLALNRNTGTAQLTTPPEAAFGPGRVSARLIRGPDAKPEAPGKGAKQSGADASGIGSMASFRADPTAPVEVTADSLDVDDKRKVAIFRGEVDAVQGAFKIHCAELSAFYKGEAGLVGAGMPDAAANAGEKKSGTELSRIEARKNVRVTSKDGQTATGDWADFDARTNKVTMGGNVVLSRGQSMVRGTRLLIDLTTGESKIDTAPQNTASSPSGGGWVTKAPAQPAAEGKGRASAVFFPQELQDEQDKPDAAKKAPAAPAVDGWSATAQPGTANR